MKLWSHTLVKNEERYVWFALRSIVQHVDKMLVWDTGSTDNTVPIIKEFKKRFPKKVLFKEVGSVDPVEFTKVSQQMLENTKADWIVLLDGDEVWWENSIKTVTQLVKERGEQLESIVQPYYNIIGDIFHYQEEKAGKYKFDSRRGHLTIRFMSNKIPGLHYDKEHGQRGLYDSRGSLIQNRRSSRRIYLNQPYMHFTNMLRSISRQKDSVVPKRSFKYKFEIGKEFPKDFYYPDVFFLPRPKIVPSPWVRRSNNYILKATFQTPIKKIKRRMDMFNNSGY